MPLTMLNLLAVERNRQGCGFDRKWVVPAMLQALWRSQDRQTMEPVQLWTNATEHIKEALA